MRQRSHFLQRAVLLHAQCKVIRRYFGNYQVFFARPRYIIVRIFAAVAVARRRDLNGFADICRIVLHAELRIRYPAFFIRFKILYVLRSLRYRII